MRKRLMVASIAGVASLVLASLAYGAVTVDFKASVSPNKANKPAGLKVRLAASDAAAPQPPIMDRILIKLNAGGKYNGPKFPKCTKAIILSKGPKSCPKGSQIGKGNGVGYAKPVVTEPVKAALQIFNGGNSVLVYALPDLGAPFVTTCKITGGYNLDCGIDPIRTVGDAPDAAVGTVKTKTTPKSIKKGKKKLGMIVTPKKCKGTWKSSAKFSFRTGETVTKPFSQKCKK